ncbi:MAG: PIG-L family deacetylase [Elusimicrobiota bacterium]|nr:MAG: PIG-L family deacetylase [Elusimicrobiota bacterium]
MSAKTAPRRAPDVLAKYAGQTVVAVGAHPDDLELGLGGTLKRLSDAGARVVMAVVSIPSDRESRIKEANAAARILGGETHFLTPDRTMRVEDLKNHELVGMMDGLVKQYEPAALFTHSLANLHKDHKLVHEACMSSQRLRYFDLFCYPPTSCHAINVQFNAHAYIDISPVIDAKMRAIRMHSTQFARRGLKTDHYREASSRVGQIVGVPYAESLEIVRMRLN